MSRAPRESPSRRRELILSAAREEFAQKGFHQTSIADVCSSLRISRGTLYRHFENKDALFHGVLDELLTKVRAAADAMPALTLPPGFRPTAEQAMQFYAFRLTSVLDLVFGDPSVARLLAGDRSGLPGASDRLLSAIDTLFLDSCTADIRHGQEAGLLRDSLNAESTSLLMLGGVQKLGLAQLRSQNAVDVPALAKAVSETLMLGLFIPKES